MPTRATKRHKIYKRDFVSIFCAFLWLLLVSATAFGAAPHAIIIQGEGLVKPVVLTDWDENARLMLSLDQEQVIANEELAGRPYLELYLFWGPEWRNYALDELRPERANQQGRLYLATNRAKPAVLLNGVPARKLNDDGINILAQHGVTLFSKPLLPLALVVCLILAGIVTAFLFLTRNRSFWHTAT